MQESQAKLIKISQENNILLYLDVIFTIYIYILTLIKKFGMGRTDLDVGELPLPYLTTVCEGSDGIGQKGGGVSILHPPVGVYDTFP